MTPTVGVMADGYDWRHGWVPLTMHAALLKAHGRHAEAEALLERGRRRRRGRRARSEFVTPHPAHRAEHAARRQLRAYSDDQLAHAMGATDDEATIAVLVAELERRDRADRKAAADRGRRHARRAARDEARQADAERRIAAGEDEAEAYRAAYGTTEEQERRQEAMTALRSAGYSGRNLDQLIRHAHADHAAKEWRRAEDATNGYLVNKQGRARGIDPRSLFTGTDARARKYASEELLDYWQEHGRMSAEDFRAGVLGGRMQPRGTYA